jgi:L-alanine-DL-glutamate epimerase-like enolase superfamily enzyme
MKLGVVTPIVTRLPRAHASWEETAGIEEIARTSTPFDPGAEPDRARDAAERLTEAGSTTLNVRVVHHSLDHYLEQLAAMRELIR